MISATFIECTFARRAAGHGEILAGQVHQPAADSTSPGNHPVGGQVLALHPEQCRAVGGEQADLLEAALMDEGRDRFPGGQLAGLPLFVLPRGAATQKSLLLAAAQVVDQILHGAHHRVLVNLPAPPTRGGNGH